MLSSTKYKSKQCTGNFGLPNISTPTPGFWPTNYAWVKVNINPGFIHPFSLSVSFRAILTWKNIDRLLLNTRPLTFNDIHFSLAINLNPTRTGIPNVWLPSRHPTLVWSNIREHTRPHQLGHPLEAIKDSETRQQFKGFFLDESPCFNISAATARINYCHTEEWRFPCTGSMYGISTHMWLI